MDVRVLLFGGVLCLQLSACASPDPTGQNALADAAVRNYFENAACTGKSYAHEGRDPHACDPAEKQQKRAGLFGAWGKW